jgi:hypothetical protein
MAEATSPTIVTIWLDDIVAGVTVFHAQRKLFLVPFVGRRCKITVRPSLKFNNY